MFENLALAWCNLVQYGDMPRLILVGLGQVTEQLIDCRNFRFRGRRDFPKNLTPSEKGFLVSKFGCFYRVLAYQNRIISR